MLHPGRGEAEYKVEEEDSYFIGTVNLNNKGIAMGMKVELSSKIYDTTKAKSQCSANQGFCRLKLLFPNTQYVLLATPTPNDVHVTLPTSSNFIYFKFTKKTVEPQIHPTRPEQTTLELDHWARLVH